MHCNNNQTVPHWRETSLNVANSWDNQTSPQIRFLICWHSKRVWRQNSPPHNVEYCFKFEVLSVSDPEDCKIFKSTTPTTDNKQLKEIWIQNYITSFIQKLTPDDNRSSELLAATKQPVSSQLRETIKLLLMKDEILYNNKNRIEILSDLRHERMAVYHSNSNIFDTVY